MAEILEVRVSYQVVDPDATDDSHERQAAEQLLDIIKGYLRTA